MSADFYLNAQIKTARKAITNLLQQPTRHIMLVFHGGMPDPGKQCALSETHTLVALGGASRAVLWGTTAAYFSFHWAAKIKATWTEDPLRDATEYLKRFFDPRGLLLVAGNSAGGLNALEFCRGLEDNLGYFEFKDELLPEQPDFRNNYKPKSMGFFTKTKGQFGARVRVDRLYTLDAAFSVLAGERANQVKVPSLVILNRNYYQTLDNTKETDAAKLAVLDRTQEYHAETVAENKDETAVVQVNGDAQLKSSSSPHVDVIERGWRELTEDLVGNKANSTKNSVFRDQLISPQNRTFLANAQ